MKFFGLIAVLAVAASCQGAPEDREHRAALVDTILEKIEDLRDILTTGSDSLGLPVLDPYQADKFEVAIDEENLKLDADVTDVDIRGIAGFVIENLDVSLLGMTLSYEVSWPTLTASGRYRIDSTIAKAIPVFGEGDTAVELTDLRVSGTIQLGIKDSYLNLNDVATAIDLGDFKLNIGGILDNEDLSALISAVATDATLAFLADYQTAITSRINAIVISEANKVLGTLTLADLIGLINGQAFPGRRSFE